MKGVDEERSVSAGHGKASPRFAACRVGDARRVRAGRLGTFGLKYGAFAGGGKETGWKGVLERVASIGEARPNCSQPVSLNGGPLAGPEMPGAFVPGGLERSV